MSRDSRLRVVRSMVLPIMILLVLLTIVTTLARQFTSTTLFEFAKVAELNVEITAPAEFASLSDDNPLFHFFTEKNQKISFDFSIFNDDEVVIICKPYFEGDVQFKVIVDETECNDFVIEIGETVEFTIEVISNGLKAKALATNLVINVEQLGG